MGENAAAFPQLIVGRPPVAHAVIPFLLLIFYQVSVHNPQQVIQIRCFVEGHVGFSEDPLRDLWRLEIKFMHLLHVDSTGSQTWFLDSCGQKKHRKRRLLLSNHDLGVALPSGAVQLGLNFDESLPELFEGTKMGEDALRMLRQYLKLHNQVLFDVADELPQVKAAALWAGRLSRSSTSQRNIRLAWPSPREG